MIQEKLYAIIDGAAEPDLFLALERYDPPSTCLYGEPLQPELVNIVPYLVQVTEEVKIWLECRKSPWGIFVHSAADMKTVRQHLRKYLQVLLPQQEKPVFFRFYDPRNIWDFLGVLSDWEVHCFLGPITRITTRYLEEERTDNFVKIRKPFPDNAKGKYKIFKISEEQYELIEIKKKEQYLQKLDSILLSELAELRISISINNSLPFLAFFYDYLMSEKITDTRSIEGILKKVIREDNFDIDNFDKSILTNLTDDGTPGWYRANQFIYNIKE
ncbi:DUF4123 domain-containing protein [Xenorhabdus griffiniae]|uniref:DUF4123 domain-containing protein n=1 Tax=Xenorhabdus griffiniae TaxID=351672 RepID=A0ABY9XJS9_9GAMM|nr:DUF4123 domain-containing protein [Xenorhabdus griffiniae]MBD1227618.1 DUF4123 domain-containing protein [Xenorhabdus griffiniae]MBE8589228.1 DUF4123 domain-containing protein [Xenorhabdus griffiniae]WMV73183.1 DUF4123 domain-containing protein [Xenorhabdus griffiniae]WNH02862.1 DUF4123 domain-containing protein [Xenorhabdus griffiniae]